MGSCSSSGKGTESSIAKGKGTIKLDYHNENMTEKQIADKKQAIIDRIQKFADAGTENFKRPNGDVDYYYQVYDRDWKNYGKDRTYITVYEKRIGTGHQKHFDFGFIDNKTGDYSPGRADALSKDGRFWLH